jgi:L-ascorbate metabolism protein UlaG (beta-lactamase superfamily)
MKINRRKFIVLGLLGGAFTLLKGFGNNLFARNLSADGPKESPLKPSPKNWNEDEVSICWIGHSSFLINFYGTIFLTDPVLSNRIGIYFLGMNWGPQRFVQPALTIDEIPKPDFILLSHAHLDHMDYPTLKAFAQKYPGKIDVLTSFATKDVIEDLNWKSIEEIDWNESAQLHGIKIEAVKVKHFGWRYPWEKDRSKGNPKGRSYNSYILEKNRKKILFAGDTAFTELYKPYKNDGIDIAMMPIGAYNPWRYTHCTPEEALKMADDMNAKYFIPMHTRTFPQGREPYEEAIDWMKNSAEKYKPQIGLTEIGETFVL